jgi:hypothetical protein
MINNMKFTINDKVIATRDISNSFGTLLATKGDILEVVGLESGVCDYPYVVWNGSNSKEFCVEEYEINLDQV